MPEAIAKDFGELVTAVILGQHPILPRPDWGQDAAAVGWTIDVIRDRAAALERDWEETLDELLVNVPKGARQWAGSEQIYLDDPDPEIPREAIAVMYVRWLEERVNGD